MAGSIRPYLETTTTALVSGDKVIVDSAARGTQAIDFDNLSTQFEIVARKGVANGYASLDSSGKVPAAQLRSPYTIEEVADAAARNALTVITAEIAVRQVRLQDTGVIYVPNAAGTGAGIWVEFNSVGEASTSAKGIVELSTSAEGTTGDSELLAMTPFATQAAVAPLRNALAPAGGIYTDGTTSTYVRSTLTGQNIGDDPASIHLRFRVPSESPSTEHGLFFAGPAAGAWDRNSLMVYITTAGDLNFLISGDASTGDNNRVGYAGFVAEFAGQVVNVVLVRPASGQAKIYVNGKSLTLSATTAGTPPGWQGTLETTYINVGAYNSSTVAKGEFYGASLYNCELSQSDVTEIHRLGGSVPFRFQYGSQAALASGSFSLGKRYRIATRTDGDFTTAGAADNNVGTEWNATATASGVLDAGDTALQIGAIVHFTFNEGIGYQLHDASTNKLDAVMTTTGVHHLIAKREGYVRTPGAGLTWAGSHEAKVISGVDQQILPFGARVLDVTTKASAATAGAGMVLSDDAVSGYWVAAAALTTDKKASTVAQPFASAETAGKHKLNIDPDDQNYTGTIAMVVSYRMTEGTCV